MNILEILKSKPIGTRLWSPVFGNVRLNSIDEEDIHPIEIKFYHNTMREYETEKLTCAGRLDFYDGAECIIFPSKNMRDWSKFAWKKGDVLHAGGERFIIFDHYDNPDYSRVFGKYRYDKSDDEVISDVQIHTSKCEKTDAATTALVIASIETRLGGKLNPDTLEIERPQCQFKPFDKVLVRDTSADKWKPALFSYTISGRTRCTYMMLNGNYYYECVPYEGNEHLLGTTDSPSNEKENE